MESHKSVHPLFVGLLNIWFLTVIGIIIKWPFPILVLSAVDILFLLFLILKNAKFLKFFFRVSIFLFLLILFQFYNASGEILYQLGPFYVTVTQLQESGFFFLRYVFLFGFLYYFLSELLELNLTIIRQMKQKNTPWMKAALILEEIWVGLILLPEVFEVTRFYKEKLVRKNDTPKKKLFSRIAGFPESMVELYETLYNFIRHKILELDLDQNRSDGIAWIKFLVFSFFVGVGMIL
jgi:hypothetical protein